MASGRATDTTLPGLDQPLYGWWDVVQGGAIVASSGVPNGWNVESDQSVYDGAWVTAPLTPSPAVENGYELRVASIGAADFAVESASSMAQTEPRLLPIAVSANPVVSPAQITVTFSIDAPAPTNGAHITVTADPRLNMSSAVIIPAGLTTVQVPIQTSITPSAPISTLITAKYNGTRSITIVLEPTADINGPAGSGTNTGPTYIDATSAGVAGALGAPTELTASAETGSVSLDWTPPAITTGIIGYNVLRSTSATGSFSAIFRGLTGTSFVDSNVVNNQTYYYAVVAVNLAGPSAYSNTPSATP